MGIVADLKRRLFRWQSDGTAPLRLAQRRIFILPTRAGLLFAAALLAMLTGAIAQRFLNPPAETEQPDEQLQLSVESAPEQ